MSTKSPDSSRRLVANINPQVYAAAVEHAGFLSCTVTRYTCGSLRLLQIIGQQPPGQSISWQIGNNTSPVLSLQSFFNNQGPAEPKRLVVGLDPRAQEALDWSVEKSGLNQTMVTQLGLMVLNHGVSLLSEATGAATPPDFCLVTGERENTFIL